MEILTALWIFYGFIGAFFIFMLGNTLMNPFARAAFLGKLKKKTYGVGTVISRSGRGRNYVREFIPGQTVKINACAYPVPDVFDDFDGVPHCAWVEGSNIPLTVRNVSENLKALITAEKDSAAFTDSLLVTYKAILEAQVLSQFQKRIDMMLMLILAVSVIAGGITGYVSFNTSQKVDSVLSFVNATNAEVLKISAGRLMQNLTVLPGVA